MPRDRLHDELESRSASRELILVPNHSVPPGSGPTYPVRPDEQRHDAAYYQKPPASPKVTGRRLLLGIGILSQVAIVILAGAALYVAMGGHGALPSAVQSPGTQQLPVKAAASATNMPGTTTEASRDSSAALATASIAPATPAFPRPTAYGIYAISNSRLIELEQIATSSVDPRTRSTLQIVKPTRTVITDPKLTFVAFRRDLVSSAPDRLRERRRIIRMSASYGNPTSMTVDTASTASNDRPSQSENRSLDVGRFVKRADGNADDADAKSRQLGQAVK